MVLLFRNTNSYLLVSIEYVKMMFSCRYGIETIIYALSHHKFGDISLAAKNILLLTKKGEFLNDAIGHTIQKIKHKNHKKFWMAMKSEKAINTIMRLNELSRIVMKERELAITNLVDKLSSNLNKIVLALSFSLLIFLIPIFNQTAQTSDIFSGLHIPIIFTYYFLVILIIIIFLLLLNTRYKEAEE